MNDEKLRQKIEAKTVKNSKSTSSLDPIPQQEVPYFGNLQFNCYQVSPTVSKILQYNSQSIPFKKKKMIKHTFEHITDRNENLLAKLKLLNKSNKNPGEQRANTKPK